MIAKLLSLVLLFGLVAEKFTGTYTGKLEESSLKLDLTQAGTKLTGTAQAEGITFKIEGTVSGEQATGTVSIIGEKMPFKASFTGEKLIFQIGEYDEAGKPDWSEPDRIEFTRENGVASTEKPPKESIVDKAKKFSNKPIGTLANGKEYVHSSGGKFRYPAGWKIEEAEGGLKLTPPDAANGELIFISAEPAQGKTDAADPEVIAYVDQLVTQALPAVKRSGKPEEVRAAAGKGVALTWAGGGQKVRAYMTILKNNGVSIVAVGTEAQVDKRDPVIREIFYTFGWGQGKTDPRLVGTWQYFSYSQVSGRSTTAKATLAANGQFSYQSDSEAANNYSGKDGLGNQTWTGWVNSRSGSGYKGTWSAAGNTLTLNFEDGSTEQFDFKFEQQGTAFVLKLYGSNPNKPMEWSKISN